MWTHCGDISKHFVKIKNTIIREYLSLEDRRYVQSSTILFLNSNYNYRAKIQILVTSDLLGFLHRDSTTVHTLDVENVRNGRKIFKYAQTLS